MTHPVKLASERFTQGLNCAQAVFSAFAPQMGLSDEAALRIASPFGGGVARQGQVCGAVTGALMALGLQRGNTTTKSKEETYQLAADFVRHYQEAHGTILCADLVGYDISTQPGLQAARESRVFTTVCPRLVEDAAKLLTEFLKE